MTTGPTAASDEAGAGWAPRFEDALRRVTDPDGALLFAEDREDLTVVCDSRTGLESVHTYLRGLSARGDLAGGRSIHLSDPGPEDPARLLKAVLDPRSRLPGHAAPGGTGPRPATAPERLDPRAAAALVRGLEADLRRTCPSAVARARWVGSDQRVAVGRPGRTAREDHRRGARVRLEAWLARDGRHSMAAAERVLGPDPATWPGTVAGLPALVASRLEARLWAHPAPRGETTAVFAPGVAGVLIHELVGHALEGDAAIGGAWTSRIGEGFTAPGVTVVDDPRRARTAWRIDDEGETARPTLLMRDGRAAGWLLDLRTSRLAGRKPTGHGRRASFREPVRPRMGCTFLAAGKLSPEEVMDGTTGIYISRLETASVDPASGTALLRVTDADLLEHGRAVVALHPHLLLVHAPRMLPAIDRIADDLAFDTCVGSCQRQAQALAVSVGAPTIRSGVVSVIA